MRTVQLAPPAAGLRGIRAGSASAAPGRTSHNPPVVGSSPTRPTSGFDTRGQRVVDRIVYRCRRGDVRTVGPPGPPQQERPPDLGSLRAARGQILAAASQRGLRDVRVFGSVARGEAVETSDVDLLVAPGPDTTLFDLSGFALDVEEIIGRHVDVATPRGLKARIRDRVLAEAVAL